MIKIKWANTFVFITFPFPEPTQMMQEKNQPVNQLNLKLLTKNVPH